MQNNKKTNNVLASVECSTKANSIHDYETIYILSAVDIKPINREELQKDFEIFKIMYPIWKKKSFKDFLKWKAGFYETKYKIDTYDTAYFLNLDTAIQYAKANMADINESGSYPYLVIYTRPTNKMYSETDKCMVKLFIYNGDKNEYEEINDIKSKEIYLYIVSKFDMFCKLPKETV